MRTSLLIAILPPLALHSMAHAGIDNISAAFQGGQVAIAGSGLFQYNLTTTPAVAAANAVSFQSRFRFFSKYTAPGGLVQLFRRNSNYLVSFDVTDPRNLGYKLKIRRVIKGVSSINWTGSTNGNNSTGTLGYSTGLFQVNGSNIALLRIGDVVDRTVSILNQNPADVLHQQEATAIIGTYQGNRSFSIRDNEAASQLSHVYQNYNTGTAQLKFGMESSVGNGIVVSADDSGDALTFTIIYNPSCSLTSSSPTSATLDYTGVLQESEDLVTWTDVVPQPASPVTIATSAGRKFFRARSVE